MGKRRSNYRWVKIHRSYKVEEIAKLYSIHKNTVRMWIKDGLSTIDNQRPMLIHGLDLYEFLKTRKEKRKQKCKPGEFYCFRCRVPRKPDGDWAEYSHINDKVGILSAICPICSTIMNRTVNLKKIDSDFAGIEITF